MAQRSQLLRLVNIVELIEHIRGETHRVTYETFKTDWRTRWLVERGLEIVSEASRHLSGELKDRHPDIPWRRIAGIGNVLRHDYERTAPDVLWRAIQDDISALEAVCREELAAERAREQGASGGV